MRKKHVYLIGAIGLFALVHAGYWLLGVRYDMSTLDWYQQFLDPALLKTRLLESLFYLHSQPPIYNLFLGLVLKAAPGRELVVFQAISVAWGLIFYLTIFGLLICLGARRLLAFGLSAVFMASPSFILYEHWLFYTFPLSLVVTLAALVLLMALRQGKVWQWMGFATALFLASGIHSLFHLAYLVVAIAAIAWLHGRDRKKIILTALIPLVFMLAIYGKNLALFGKFTTSTWMGMNFWGMTARNMHIAERRQLAANGEISRVSLLDRFADPEFYSAAYFEIPGYEGIPALRQLKKQTGASNYNHLGYIALSDQYMADALYVLRNYPQTLLVGSLRAWFAYFRSSSDNLFLSSANRASAGPIVAIYDTLFFGKLPLDLAHIPGLPIYTESRGHYLYLFLLAGLPLLVLCGLRAAWRGRLLGSAFDPAGRITLLFLCFNILYVALLGNALEVGENNRFRFVTDPSSFVLLGVVIEGLLGRRAGRRV